MGAKHLAAHADNCIGQNKNNTMLQVQNKLMCVNKLILTCSSQYLCWRVMVGLNESISLSFLLVGHTKFTPDACFGLFKKRFRQTNVQSLKDIVEVVNTSAEVNTAEVIGWEDGKVLIPTYDWTSFFAERMKKISGIKQFHHFQFSTANKGSVCLKIYSESNAESVKLLKDPTWRPKASELPMVVEPTGLSPSRQWYLYEKIRPFCTGDAKDTTCPLPAFPRSTPIGSPAPPSPPSSPRSPPQKKRRVCSNCGSKSHNRRTCNV